MQEHASDLARRLARQAEAVCRHYLSNGRREGRYWLVGDVENSHGRSLYVRLTGADSGKGAAGKWTDAATGAHGDLLDLIAASRRLDSFRDVLDEARSFLSMPRSEPPPREPPAPTGSPEAARRLFALAKPIGGTLSEAYLNARGIIGIRSLSALRHHPHCYYRPGDGALARELDTFAAERNKPRSLVVEAAIRAFLTLDDADRREAAIAKRLDRIVRVLERLERNDGVTLEALAMFVRFWLTASPGLPEQTSVAARHKGGERYERFIEALGRRLANGPSVLKEVALDMPSQQSDHPESDA